MQAKLLYVVTAISNPHRLSSRTKLYKEFETHMLDSGVNLTLVECASGERPFELNDNPHVNHIGVRSKTITWNKECLLNIGITRLPTDAKYIGWFDADIYFRRANWASEAVHALQHYDVIQPWTHAYDLGPNDEHIQTHTSFAHQMFYGNPLVADPNVKNFWNYGGTNMGYGYGFPHPGYAWCATRQALEWLGLLFDVCLMGSGDYHMALALAGLAEKSLPGKVNDHYYNALMQWQERAMHHINKNVGYCSGTIEHGFHGRKEDRQYIDRWDIFLNHDFNPLTDIKKNAFGVYEFCGNKPDLKREFDIYLRSRNEDINSL